MQVHDKRRDTARKVPEDLVEYHLGGRGAVSGHAHSALVSEPATDRAAAPAHARGTLGSSCAHGAEWEVGRWSGHRRAGSPWSRHWQHGTSWRYNAGISLYSYAECGGGSDGRDGRGGDGGMVQA